MAGYSMVIPRFLDVEASSLSMDSYPIEIAWSDHFGDIESHLINPYGIKDWTDWDYNAQQMHGINREQCREEGLLPDDMCRRMSQSIKPGEIIYADGGGFDENWVDVLYSEGSVRGFAQFRIVHSDTLLLPLLATIEIDAKKRWQLYEKLKLQARQLVGRAHRAEPDVRYLIELWKLCLSTSKAA
jgi:hypothetical protein